MSNTTRDKVIEEVYRALPGYYDIDWDAVMDIIALEVREARLDELNKMIDANVGYSASYIAERTAELSKSKQEKKS